MSALIQLTQAQEQNICLTIVAKVQDLRELEHQVRVKRQEIRMLLRSAGYAGRVMPWTRVAAFISSLCLLLPGCSAPSPKPDFKPMPPPGRTPLAAAPVPVSVAQTKSVTLAWDAVNYSTAGYAIHYGGKTGTYTNTVTAGSATATTVVVPGLIPKATYFFAVTAKDSEGRVSDYSNEVQYQVPGKRVKLVTEQSGDLIGGQWSGIATNYDEPTARSSFYRINISADDL